MNKILSILTAGFLALLTTGLTSCSDDDDVIESNREGLYEGTLTTAYYDGADLIKTESFKVLVVAEKLSGNSLNCKVYRQSRYNRRWVGEEMVHQLLINFSESENGLVGDNNGRIFGDQLVFKYTCPDETDATGKVNISAQFSGVKAGVTDIATEIDPEGKYKGTYTSYSEIYASEDDYKNGKKPEEIQQNFSAEIYATVVYDSKSDKLVTTLYYDPEMTSEWASPYESKFADNDLSKLVCGNITFTRGVRMSYINREKDGYKMDTGKYMVWCFKYEAEKLQD